MTGNSAIGSGNVVAFALRMESSAVLENFLKNSNVSDTFPLDFSICEICLNRFGIKSNIISDSVSLSKNCSICFGIFDEEFLEKTAREIVEQTERNQFTDFEQFQCTLSAPLVNTIAEHAFKLQLQNRQNFDSGDGYITPINKTWRTMLSVKLQQLLGKSHCDVYKDSLEDNCISIDCCIKYKDEDKKILRFCELMDSLNFKTRKIQRRKFQDKLFSKKSILNLLNELEDENLFFQNVKQSNILSTFESLEIISISIRRNPLYLAGRYLKFSRNLPQSPWTVRKSDISYEVSLEDLIIDPLVDFLKTDRSLTTFSASGREDIDVRCLGNGRPFVIELKNPKRILFDKNEINQMQNLVNSATNLIEIKNFQIVCSESIVNIKKGEESKTKTYMAYCICEKPLESLVKVNEMIGSKDFIQIEQKTPIRVLHRRSLQSRSKKIHKIEAKFREGFKDQFLLEIQCQAGTYIKEFVHGDFGRTIPSISSVLGCDTIVAALDVTAVNIDWLLN